MGILYLIGDIATLLYWVTTLFYRVPRSSKEWGYYFKIILCTVFFSWFGLWLSVKSDNQVKKKRKLLKSIRNLTGRPINDNTIIR